MPSSKQIVKLTMSPQDHSTAYLGNPCHAEDHKCHRCYPEAFSRKDHQEEEPSCTSRAGIENLLHSSLQAGR